MQLPTNVILFIVCCCVNIYRWAITTRRSSCTKPWNHQSSNASSSLRPLRDHASLKLASERYGTLTDSFRTHLDDIVNDRLDYNEVASLLVCLIHKRNCQSIEKLVRKTSSVENVLLQRFECFEGWTEYEDWMDFYIDEPLQEIAERTKESLQGSINQQLFSIANKIQRRKSI